jgi:hypothetical protein
MAPGSVFAEYRIEGVAGRGGMGVVYRATDLRLDRTVALKFIAAGLASEPGFRERFTRESRVAASLEHPNVIPIFSAGEHDGVLFLAMRYVDGEDLRGEIQAEGRLQPERAAAIATQVASALDAAHAGGLVHRDIKPANVLLAANDHVYLTDFGLTKRTLGDPDQTKSGELIGTVNYLAPEQIRGEAVTAQTDVYALGCVLFHALTGQVPFPLDGQEAKLWAHLSEPPPSVSGLVPVLPKALDGVLARALAKAPSDRFETTGALAEAAATSVARAGARPAAGGPAESPGGGRSDRRAVLRSALLDPFGIVLSLAVLAAGAAFGVLPVVIPLALVVYATATTRAYFDHDVREKVVGRRALSAEPSRIEELLSQALDKEQRIRSAIKKAQLPYKEVAEEVDRLVTTMRETARRARLLDRELEDTPPEAIERRLDLARTDGDPDTDELVHALSEQLTVQREMQDQLRRFHAQMRRVLVELDTVRARMVATSTAAPPGHQQQLAEDVRDLRAEVGAVADDMAEAYEGQSASYPHFGTERT